MEQNKSSAGADLWKTILPFFSDLFPLIMDKWADVHERPVVKNLERELLRLKHKHERLHNQLRWLYSFFFLLLVWNVFLTIFMVFMIK